MGEVEDIPNDLGFGNDSALSIRQFQLPNPFSCVITLGSCAAGLETGACSGHLLQLELIRRADSQYPRQLVTDHLRPVIKLKLKRPVERRA